VFKSDHRQTILLAKSHYFRIVSVLQSILMRNMNYNIALSRPGNFNKMPRIFEIQPQISFISARTQHYMPVPHKPREANQTIQIIAGRTL
jgi:hypothetical protein